MPIIKKKSAMSEAPKADSLAIAYGAQKSMKRKYADGGKVEPKSASEQISQSYGNASDPDKRKAAADSMKNAFGGGMAHGGEVEEHYESIADAILAKKRRMSDGGQVDIEQNSVEEPNEYDELNMEAADEPVYEEPKDIAGQIRAKRAKRG